MEDVMPGQGPQAAEVLGFWFVQSPPRQWFAKDSASDALLRERLLERVSGVEELAFL